MAPATIGNRLRAHPRRLHGSGVAVALGASLLAAGCAGPADRETAERLARERGLVPAHVDAGAFRLLTRRRGLGTGDVLVVYVEGDGAAWRDGTPPADPTPRRPVALALAARDPSRAVLWIARPCQFTGNAARARGCTPRYWSSHRYAPAVVEAIEAAIERALSAWAPERRPALGLVGHSGGGTVAALVAARHPERVAWLVTVAANLDHPRWTALHDVSPLAGSLDAAGHAPRLRALAQLHLVGARDTVVPPGVVEGYLERLASPAAALEVRAGFDHGCCWTRVWPARLCAFLDTRGLPGAAACPAPARGE